LDRKTKTLEGLMKDSREYPLGAMTLFLAKKSILWHFFVDIFQKIWYHYSLIKMSR